MDRLTRALDDGTYVVDSSKVEPNIHGYSGEAIDKLARFENFYLDLLASQVAIPEEMEKLRQQGKTKSVRFRELMGEKMGKANLISLIKSYGL